MRAHHPPSSLISRVHCLASRVLTHNNPLAPAPEAHAGVTATAPEARRQLKAMVMQCAGVTELVAEYIILHLMSRIHTRKADGTLVLGKMSLNLMGLRTASSGAAISALLELLQGVVTKMHVMDMTIETLNTARLIPEKDIVSNRLKAGRLQLADGTLLVLNEMALQQGQIKDTGVRNLKALGHLIQDQYVEYNFKFNSIPFPADVPVLVISEGKSLLPVEFPIVCELTGEPGAVTVPNDVLNAIRVYLTVCREMEHTIADDCRDVIQADFVALRQADDKVSAETLHSMLVLARLNAQSKGEAALSVQTWKETVALEQARVGAVEALIASQTPPAAEAPQKSPPTPAQQAAMSAPQPAN